MPVVGRQSGLGGGQPGHQALHGQGFEDHARGKGQHLVGTDAEQLAHGVAGGLGRLTAGLAGTGVGDAGVDHQGTDARAFGQVLAAQLHGSGAETVEGEHAGHRGPGFQLDQGQVLAVLLADLGLGHPEADAGDGMQGCGSGSGVIHRHGKLQNS